MNRNLVVGAVVVVLVVGLGLAAAIGPLGVLDGDGRDVPPATTTETADEVGSSDSGNGDGGDGTTGDEASTEPPPIGLRVDSVEPCGQTCRDVTATLSNNQDRRATGVTVQTTIYAGEDTEGDVVWEGSREVGTLEPGESETDTTRIELGFFEAATVQSAGGEITIETVVETDRQTFRFVERRDVS